LQLKHSDTRPLKLLLMNNSRFVNSLLLLFFLSCFTLSNVYSQCNTNTSICTPGTAGPFNFYPASNNPSTCLDFINGSSAPNYGYIILYITQGGNLDLLIQGTSTSGGTASFGCLDVALFDITNSVNPCPSLSPSTQIGCNYVAPCEGCAEFGYTINGCNAQMTAPVVQAGDIIMILVEDYSDVLSDFSISLGNGPNSAQTGPPDATIDLVNGNGNICSDAPAYQLTAENMGGTWSGTGVSPGGSFNPAVAGVGSHTITYNIGQAPCDAQSQTTVNVINCNGCFMNSIDITIHPCEQDGHFEITGELQFTLPPVAGNLIIEDCNGNSVSYAPPFASPFNFTLSNILADGTQNCNLTAYFSSEPTCTITVGPYNNPPPCGCTAQIGNFAASMTGISTNNYVLCYGDEIDIVPTGGFVAAEEETGTNPPTYSPGIGWLVYSCPPSVATVPSMTDDIMDDPCFLGLVTDGSFYDDNDMYWINNFPGVFTNNIVYFVPITMYSLDQNIYSYAGDNLLPCYQLGSPYAVQYLPEITTTSSQDCQTGQLTVTVQGGLPAVNGSSFTASALSPASATFVNTTALNGGNIVVGGLVNGQAYSFTITDNNGCPRTVSGTFTGQEIATLTYPQTSYCQNEPNPSPSIVGTQGGTYSSGAGLSINSSTGVINLAASTPGAYTIVYQTPHPICFGTTSFNLTIHPVPNVFAGNDIQVCQNSVVTLTASGADSYVWDNGVVNGVPFTPTTGVYTVIGTTTAGCSNTDQLTITNTQIDAPVFNGNNLYGCAPLTTTFTNTSIGTFASCVWNVNGQLINNCGTISQTFTSPGCYNVSLTVTTNDGCTNTTTYQNYVCVEANPIADFTPSPNTMGSLTPFSQMLNNSSGAVTYEWDFGDGSPINTEISPSHNFPNEPGVYVITLTAYSNGGCQDVTTQVVVINEELIFYVPNAFTPDNDDFNQTFQPVFTSGFDPFNFNMLIFNRWGEVLFESNNADIGWDGTYGGKLVQDGTYIWKITYMLVGVDKRQEMTGHVTLIR